MCATLKNLIKILGSLSFALLLLGTLVVLLTASTLMESAYGTPFAQRLFYEAGWFDVFLGLLAVNILFSALSRWPYKLHHTGFLITHAGILLFLTGSLLSRLAGAEGQLALLEGENKDHMLKTDYQLTVREPENTSHSWKLKSFSRKTKAPLPLAHPTRKLTLERLEEGVLFEPGMRDGGPLSPQNHAIRFTLQSEMAQLDESFWLVEKSEDPSFSDHLSVGLAQLQLKEGKARSSETEAATSAQPELRLTRKSTGKTVTIPLTAGDMKKFSVKDIGVNISDVTYFPDARVDGTNELVNVSDAPRNPAVRFTLDDGKGQKERRVLFTLFPDFESIHGKKSAAFKDLTVEFLAPKSELAGEAPKSGLIFYFSNEGWTYEARSKKGRLSGEVKTGASQPTGWMDFHFRVEEMMNNAVAEKKAAATGNSKKGDTGVFLSLSENGTPLGSQWAAPENPASFQTPEGPLTAVVGAPAVALPFRLELIDFRKKDYPGTANAASFESDVLLEDPVDRVRIQKTIWMNHPLDYKGYRIFQSSYIQDPRLGETSVFTVAKNPGIAFIYGGAVIIFIGILCVFYVKPFSYLNARNSHASKK